MILSIIIYFNLIQRYFEIENSTKPEDISEKISIIRELGYSEKADRVEKTFKQNSNKENIGLKNDSEGSLKSNNFDNEKKIKNEGALNSENLKEKSDINHDLHNHEHVFFTHIESVVISEYFARNELSKVANLLTKALFEDKKVDDYNLFIYGVTLYKLNYTKEATDVFFSLEKKISENSKEKPLFGGELYHFLLKLTPNKKDYYIELIKERYPKYLEYNDL